MPLTRITTQEIKDLSLTNADIANNANIADTKLSVIATAGKVANSATSATAASIADTIVLRDVNGDFSARNISLIQLNTRNIIATVNISSPTIQTNSLTIPDSGTWNSLTGIDVNNILATNANINSCTIYTLTIEEITAQTINTNALNVGTFGGALVASGTENIVRFSFPTSGDFPDTSTYSGTLAFAEDTENLYVADGEQYTQISTYTNPIEIAPYWKKITVNFDDFTDSDLTQQAILSAIPAQSVVTGIILKHSTAFSGGTISAYNVSIGTVTDPNKYTSDFDVFQATGQDIFLYSTNSGIESFDTWNLMITATSIGGNLDTATTGVVDVWILISTLV